MTMGQMQKTVKINMTMSTELWPYQVVDEIQKVMEKGMASHPDDGWKRESVEEHIVHAIDDLAKWKFNLSMDHARDISEDHLANAFTRLMMAVALERGYIKGDAFAKEDTNG